MKQKLLILLFIMCFSQYSKAQILYTGCSDSVQAAYPHTLILSGNVTDSGVTRNTYQSKSVPCSLSNNCVFKVQWNTTQSNWEIRASKDGGRTFPTLLYTNNTVTAPNPPDSNHGTWLAQNTCKNQFLSLSVDNIQNKASKTSTQAILSSKIKLSPNPASNFIKILGLKQSEHYKIYNILGIKILEGSISINGIINIRSLSNGIYLFKLNDETLKFIKE